MIPIFINRVNELKDIAAMAKKGAFGYVTGRRRIGKTALLTRAAKNAGGFYHQAIEAPVTRQLENLAGELGNILPLFKEVVPRTWAEFFSLLSREKLPPLLVFDEFPYWVSADPALPSIFQKWIDHELPRLKTSVFISGSSQAMLYSQVLDQSAPLYGRARLGLNLKPLSYSHFCAYKKIKPNSPQSFLLFSLVGGIAHYWKLLDKTNPLANAEHLYFNESALLGEEAKNLLNDEGIYGNVPRGILDLVGRGVSVSSEIASRLGMPQNHLPRPMQPLLDLGLVHRELPYGESTRTSKKTLYSIEDASLSFYFGIFRPHQSRWPVYSLKQKMELLNLHASKQWEIFCRSSFAGASRYWENHIEIDIVAPLKNARHLVAECKWKKLSAVEEKKVMDNLIQKFKATHLAKKLGTVDFKVLSQNNLTDILEYYRS